MENLLLRCHQNVSIDSLSYFQFYQVDKKKSKEKNKNIFKGITVQETKFW